MRNGIFVELINNVAFLVSLCVVYEVSYIIPIKWKKLIPVVNGLLIGFIGIAIMLIPFRLTTGIVFDTRTILVGVTALIFGTIPTIIVVSMTIIFRIISGGAGIWMGVLTITESAVIGLLWRHFVIKNQMKHRWLSIYFFGIIIHVIMLLCTFALPWPTSLEALQKISLPVMLLYPIGTVLLSLLLLVQKEHIESLNKIAEAEARYKSLFDNHHTIMLLVDQSFDTIIDANPAACNFYGYSVKNMKSMKMSQINILPNQDNTNKLQKSVNEKQSHFIYKQRKSSGQVVDVEVYNSTIMLNGQKLIYSIVHDISKRVTSDQALRDSEKRFKLLVESAPDAIFIQTEGKFSYVNKFALLLFGARSPIHLIGTPLMARFHPDSHDSVNKIMEMLNVKKKSITTKEAICLKLDGSPIDVEISSVPIHFNHSDGALVFARDISERKKQEIEKKEFEAQLRQQQKLEAIGTLAGGVAHEINNPINGIMNYAQLILDETEETTKQGEYAKEIINETERISEIVKNLLQFSRQEKQSHSYANIYDIVNQTVSLINTIIKVDQIKLKIKMGKDLPDIKCRSQQIQQVLMNLLTNARDALNDKYEGYNDDKIIHFYCSQYIEGERRWIRIIVEDHGNGIPKQIQDKIFEPFFSTKPKDKGTGLGLSISFGIIKDHHGKISIDSKEGSFTKFILDLPVDNGWTL